MPPPFQRPALSNQRALSLSLRLSGISSRQFKFNFICSSSSSSTSASLFAQASACSRIFTTVSRSYFSIFFSVNSNGLLQSRISQLYHLNRNLYTEGFHDLGYYKPLIEYLGSKFYKTLVLRYLNQGEPFHIYLFKPFL
jgi:hypothetical protein